jgi:hypothetical protein
MCCSRLHQATPADSEGTRGAPWSDPVREDMDHVLYFPDRSRVVVAVTRREVNHYSLLYNIVILMYNYLCSPL